MLVRKTSPASIDLYLEPSPRILRATRSTSFNNAPEARKTRTEVRKAASLCLFFDRTIASYFDGDGNLDWNEGARWDTSWCRVLYSLALREMRRALRTTG